MCFDIDSSPPIQPLAGGAAAYRTITLAAEDGNEFAGFEVFATDPKGVGVVVLPDVRGLYRFYEELALRLGEAGYDSVAIDYFGRTAGVGSRDDDFEYMDHVSQTTFGGITADVAAAIRHLRARDEDRSVFTLGFCFGGSNSWHQAANGLGVTGAVGFYGHPNREFPTGATPLVERVGEISCPILGLMGGDDPGIPESEVQGFRDALDAVGADHEIVTYPGAPHSFFDRRFVEYAGESDDAWRRVLSFFEQYG